MDIAYRDIFAADDEVYKHAFYMMSASRREKCLRLRSENDRRRCIAADMLAREMISAKTGIEPCRIRFSEDKNGKPFSENADAFFNVAHSGRYVVAAVSRCGNVGIDIECIKPISPSVMRFFCSESDSRFILGDTDATAISKITDSEVLTRFFRVWCFKEAFFKKTGEGIGRHAAAISYSEHEKKELILRDAVICAVE